MDSLVIVDATVEATTKVAVAAAAAVVVDAEAAVAVAAAAAVAADAEADATLEAAINALENQKAVLDTLAALYYKPLDATQIQTLASSGFLGPLEGFGLMRRYLKQGNSGTRLELNIDFTGAFYGMREHGGKVAAPYESVFRSKTGLLNQEPRHEVFAVYKRHGIRVDDGMNTPEDHLSFELQFLGTLAEKAADALRIGELDLGYGLLIEESSFLDQHVLSWFGLFKDQALQLIETDFYRGALLATEAFLALTAETLAEMKTDLEALMGGVEATTVPAATRAEATTVPSAARVEATTAPTKAQSEAV